MQRRIIVLLSTLLLALVIHGSFGQVPDTSYRGKEEKLPREVAPQPVFFSHAKHVGAGISCLDCHGGAYKEERAGLPTVDQCMLCHQTVKSDNPKIKKLMTLQKAGERVKWVRVYEVPDFVFFSHAIHINGGVECEACHGPVHRREVLAKEMPTSMTACMNCHTAREVPNDCHLCHSLGQ